MNVYPMAPMPKNDHSIQPGSPVVEQAYRDYAPLFDAMHGARWLLAAHPASIRSAAGPAATATVNVLTRGPDPANPEGYLAQVMLGNESSVVLTLNLPPSSKRLELVVWHPGAASEPAMLGPAQQTAAGWEATVPLVRGCASIGARFVDAGSPVARL